MAIPASKKKCSENWVHKQESYQKPAISLVMKLKNSSLEEASACAGELLTLNGCNVYELTEVLQWPHYFCVSPFQAADCIRCDHTWVLRKHNVDLLEATLAQEFMHSPFFPQWSHSTEYTSLHYPLCTISRLFIPLFYTK